MTPTNGTSDTRSIRPIKFAHVVYRTRRFEEMLDWYKAVFGARIQFKNEVLAFLTYDDEHHRFAFADMTKIQPGGEATAVRGSVGVDHVAYTYSSLTDLLENFSRLRENGITPYWSVHHGVTVSLYYADPDGNQMEFQVDRFDTSDAADEFMHGEFGKNPVGVEFDPDEWLTKLRSGAPESDFLVRQALEPVSPIRGWLSENVG